MHALCREVTSPGSCRFYYTVAGKFSLKKVDDMPSGIHGALSTVVVSGLANCSSSLINCLALRGVKSRLRPPEISWSCDLGNGCVMKKKVFVHVMF
jgi:hypothetical protein